MTRNRNYSVAAVAGDLDDYERIGTDKLEKDLEDEMSKLERRQDQGTNDLIRSF